MASTPEEAQQAARSRFRHDLRDLVASPAARRYRAITTTLALAFYPLTVAVIALWGVSLVVLFSATDQYSYEDAAWLAVVRDPALRHLVAAEALLEREDSAERTRAVEAHLTLAERAGAPADLVAWGRLRATLSEWARRPAAPLPASALQQIATLRRLRPEEPLWALLGGCTAALQDHPEEAEALLTRAADSPTPLVVPVLPAPWRWWAMPWYLADSLTDTGVVRHGCRRLAVHAAAAQLRGDSARAERLLALLPRLTDRLVAARRAVAYPAGARRDLGRELTLFPTTPLSARAEALRFLETRDPGRWHDRAGLAVWQSNAARRLASAPRWGQLSFATSLLWMPVALFAGMYGLKAVLSPLFALVTVPFWRRLSGLTSLAVPRRRRLALVSLPTLGAAVGVANGVLWGQALAGGLDLDHLPCGLALGPAMAFLAVIMVGAVTDGWHPISLGRTARAAQARGWLSARVRPPLVIKLLFPGALGHTAFGIALLALILTAAWFQTSTGKPALYSLMLPAAGPELLLRDWDARHGSETDAALRALLSATTLAQAREATPPTMRQDLTEALDASQRKRPGGEFAAEVETVLGRAPAP